MARYDKHVFVCENRRPEGDSRGCCASKGAGEIRGRLKAAANEAGLKGRVRINSAGCLDRCAHGVTIVVYPEGVWYERVTLADVDEIFRSHILGGRPVERLRMPHVLPEK